MTQRPHVCYEGEPSSRRTSAVVRPGEEWALPCLLSEMGRLVLSFRATLLPFPFI